MPLGRLANNVTVAAGQTLMQARAFRTCGEVTAGWCNYNGYSQGTFGTDSCAPMTVQIVCCCVRCFISSTPSPIALCTIMASPTLPLCTIHVSPTQCAQTDADPTKAAWSTPNSINYDFAVLLATQPQVPYGTQPSTAGLDCSDIYRQTGLTMLVWSPFLSPSSPPPLPVLQLWASPRQLV